MSATFSYFRTFAAGAVRITLLYGAYQIYKSTDYGPGALFYEYRERLLDSQKFSRDDVQSWVSKNYNRDLTDANLSRSDIYPILLRECNFNYAMVFGAMVIGGLAGRQVWEQHIKRFIRGRKGYYTIKYYNRDGPTKGHGANNQVFNYSETPYHQFYESYGYLKDCNFRVPVNIHLHNLSVDLKKELESEENIDQLIPDITLKGHLMVHIGDPQKASSLLMDIEDSEVMGIRVEEFLSDYVLAKIRENKMLVEYMKNDPEEYLKYMNKYLKLLLRSSAGLDVLKSDISVVRSNEKEGGEKDETFYHD